MARSIFLNDREIQINHYEGWEMNDRKNVSIVFDVSSAEYHDITTLLYEGTFDVRVPEDDLAFRGTIINYSTSMDNLYEEGQTGEYRLTLEEVGK